MIIHQYLSGQTSLCAPSQVILNELKGELQRIEVSPGNSSGGMSKRLSASLQSFFESSGWTSMWPIDKSVPYDSYASFFIDYQLDKDDTACGHMHRYFLQLMFDNRQAIGTNLLKFEIASRNSLISGRMPVCMAVCIEDGQVRKLGWDGAAASAQEYLVAIAGPYSCILTCSPIIFSIQNTVNI